MYLALAITAEGDKEVLGLWIEQSEGAKFWLKVMNELKARGVGDILIAVVDGLTGFPDAIGAVFPQTTVQTCIVHLIRKRWPRPIGFAVDERVGSDGWSANHQLVCNKICSFCRTRSPTVGDR